MKKWFTLILRIAVAVAGLTYIVWSLTWSDQVAIPAGFVWPDGSVSREPLRVGVHRLDAATLDLEGPNGVFTLPRERLGTGPADPRFQPGIITTLRNARLGLLVAGLGLFGVVFPLQATRWWLLLRCQEMNISLFKAFRLLMVGVFFNFCMPGMTGGDVVKAYYATKGSNRWTAAVMSIVFDRLAGLLALLVLAGVAGLLMLENPQARRVTAVVWAGLGVMILSAGVYFSNRLRRALRLDRLRERLGSENILVRIDDAAMVYRHHSRTTAVVVLMSIGGHLCQMTATSLAAWALGATVPLGVLLTVLPVIFMAGSLPVTFMGLGVMEPLGVGLLQADGLASANQIIGMLVMVRVYMVVYGLTGSLVLIRGDVHLFPQVASADHDSSPTDRREGSGLND